MKKLIYTLVLLAFAVSLNAQWSEQTSGVTTVLYSVSAVDNNVVWICGAGGKVLRTTNGGTNWSLTTSPNSTLDLYNILGIDANTAVVTGSGSTAYVYKTINGGANWTQVFSQTGGFMNAISFMSLANTDALFMTGDPVGGRWSLWMSTNTGTTWDSTGLYLPQSGTETGYNNSLHVWRGPYYVTRIWFGTNNSRIYYYKYGQGWSAQPTGAQTDILSITFGDTISGAAGSTTGGLYTTNGGINWGNNPTYIGTGSINGLTFTHEGVYYSRGTSVYFSATGYVFTPYTQTGTYNHLAKPNLISSNNIWAIRSNGGISKFTSSVGITPISTEIPSAYSLSQNYPNPFNPATVIRFSLSALGNTSLKVFDIMGREVQTLVNERLKAGTYETTFDGSKLPSGTYFYKLTSGDFAQTKRLTLIK
jgi:photosystem II stability/assembly factor-like uncharacterized protein